MTHADLHQLRIIMPVMEDLLTSPKTRSTTHTIASLPDNGLLLLRPLKRLIAYLRDAYEKDNENLRDILSEITTYQPENVINLMEMIYIVIPWLRQTGGRGAALFAAQNYPDEDLAIGVEAAKGIYYLGYKQIVETEPFAGNRRTELLSFIDEALANSPPEVHAMADKLFIRLGTNVE